MAGNRSAHRRVGGRAHRRLLGVLTILFVTVGFVGPGPARAAAPPSEFVDDVNAAVTTVEHFWKREFDATGARFQPVARVFPYTPGDGSTCAGLPLAPNNASYCSPEDEIGFDVNWTAARYDEIGDAFVYYLIGHEYAHAVQNRLGNRHTFTIQSELQADCYAGAYMGDEIRAGNLVLEDGDVEELLAGLTAVGDSPEVPWFDPQAHGTAEQRTSAFARGFNGSLAACP